MECPAEGSFNMILQWRPGVQIKPLRFPDPIHRQYFHASHLSIIVQEPVSNLKLPGTTILEMTVGRQKYTNKELRNQPGMLQGLYITRVMCEKRLVESIILNSGWWIVGTWTFTILLFCVL